MAYQCIELSFCYRNDWVYQRLINDTENKHRNRQRVGTNKEDLYTHLGELLQQGWQLSQVLEISQLNANDESAYRLYYLQKRMQG